MKDNYQFGRPYACDHLAQEMERTAELMDILRKKGLTLAELAERDIKRNLNSSRYMQGAHRD